MTVNKAYRKISIWSQRLIDVCQQLESNKRITLFDAGLSDDVFRDWSEQNSLPQAAYYNSEMPLLDSVVVVNNLIRLFEGSLIWTFYSPGFNEKFIGAVVSKEAFKPFIDSVYKRGDTLNCASLDSSLRFSADFNFDTGMDTGHCFTIWADACLRSEVEEILLTGPFSTSWKTRPFGNDSAVIPLLRS